MFELPEYLTLARQMNEAMQGKVIRQGHLGNSPHKFVWNRPNLAEAMAFARLVVAFPIVIS